MQGGKDHKERKDIERHKHDKGKGREKMRKLRNME